MSQTTLLVLSGLPGCGKTSLSKQLLSRNKNGNVSTAAVSADQPWHFIHLEYDQLLPEDLERHLIEKETSETSSPWKQYRESIILCVDVFLTHLLSLGRGISLKEEPQPDKVPCALWDTFVAMVTSSIDLYMKSDFLCLLVDDNMYYRSMRYRYYQLARKYEIGFCQVHVQCDVSTACRQNTSRETPVKYEVIHEMHRKLEVPDSTRFPWEQHSLLVNSAEQIQEILKLLDKAASDPVKPLPDTDEELQNLSRVVCSENFVYQADQILRRLISEEMSSAKDRQLGKNELRTLAGTLQTLRKQILEELKSGHTLVDRDLVVMATDASKDPNNPVFIFVREQFKSGVT